MMPSPADISLVWDEISQNRPVPRSQEAPRVCPACAPVCQHYYKTQTDPRSACFNHWAPTKNTRVVFQIQLYFSITAALLFLSTPPRGGLALTSRLPPEPDSQVGSDTKQKVWSAQMEWQVGEGRSLAATRQITVTYLSEWQPTDNWTKRAGNTR